MPEFEVCVQRYVEETAKILVEADSIDEAIAIGLQKVKTWPCPLDVSWEKGDDMETPEVYAVLSADNGNTVWERG